jgi:ribosomal protein S1
MTKKKTDETMISSEAVENNTEMEEIIDVSEEKTVSADENTAPLEEPVTPKKKRATKKKTETEAAEVSEVSEAEMEEKPAPKRKRVPKEAPILTIDVDGDVETEEQLAEIAWHEIRNAYRTRRILTGMLGGIEQTDNGKTVAIVEYKGYRIIIPLREMVVNFPNNVSGDDYKDLVVRHHKLVSNMLGADIDFLVKGIDSKTRSVVASRREAMLKKRQTFYMETDNSGTYKIYDGRIVQARVIAVAEKAIRIEAFGVECSIMARDLSWDWIGDAHDRYSVGDQIVVRVLSVKRDNVEDLSIKADVKSVSDNNRRTNLSQCRIQSKYAGKVTDVHKGVVYVRLTNGVNAVAHSCYDRRMPGKKDDVSFAVTHIDEEKGVAVGIITRIIKQNL